MSPLLPITLQTTLPVMLVNYVQTYLLLIGRRKDSMRRGDKNLEEKGMVKDSRSFKMRNDYDIAESS
ncbi:hypothetical protein KIN20_018681 [Parelaphostrongylus tenuis]|uniref:Transmembrane protein n=1 Tax=Parelaphostrongylus tenuis TaxID=148309 RepID=A0AAD5QPS5_PARTN|nr:hypothetical protein KIN20_018681 [Parelaphostrongylus tenuis]